MQLKVDFIKSFSKTLKEKYSEILETNANLATSTKNFSIANSVIDKLNVVKSLNKFNPENVLFNCGSIITNYESIRPEFGGVFDLQQVVEFRNESLLKVFDELLLENYFYVYYPTLKLEQRTYPHDMYEMSDFYHQVGVRYFYRGSDANRVYAVAMKNFFEDNTNYVKDALSKDWVSVPHDSTKEFIINGYFDIGSWLNKVC